MIEDFLGALSFLSIYGSGHVPTGRSRYWFAPVGAIIAIVPSVIWLSLQGRNRAFLDGALVVLLSVVITGAIHLDGLADASDGLLPHATKEQRFAIMANPEVGAFAVTAIMVALILQVASLESLKPNIVLLISIFSLSRALSGLTLEIVPYAKADGIASMFLSGANRRTRAVIVLVAECLFCTGFMTYSVGAFGILISAVLIASFCVVIFRAHHLLGGFTGDVIGAAIVFSETFSLIAGALVLK